MRARAGRRRRSRLPPRRPLTDTVGRAAAGLVAAAAIAAAARRARSLAPSGALAAVAVGTASVAAGWDWGALLVAFFVASSALSRYGAALKEARTADVVAKGGERDAAQVLANGGLFALAALLSLLFPSPLWTAAGAGTLAAATADTWATEIGTLAGRPPRSILDGRLVPPGTSGGVTPPGILASVAGSFFMAVLTLPLGWGTPVAAAALVAGVAGSTVDSLIGATLQARRWCDRCEKGTERDVHVCGEPTRLAGGAAWLGNDAVNALCALTGAVGAAVLRSALP
ncbi:MAG: DUF92 domain-containing protein [Gemmatimonadaceae bacterium]